MAYRYEVAHSNEALPPIERAMHSLSVEDVQREYELIDTPFRLFFDDKQGVQAEYTWKPGIDFIEISLSGPASQDEADNLLAEFLIWLNGMHKGLAVVLKHRLQPDSGEQRTGE